MDMAVVGGQAVALLEEMLEAAVDLKHQGEVVAIHARGLEAGTLLGRKAMVDDHSVKFAKARVAELAICDRISELSDDLDALRDEAYLSVGQRP